MDAILQKPFNMHIAILGKRASGKTEFICALKECPRPTKQFSTVGNEPSPVDYINGKTVVVWEFGRGASMELLQKMDAIIWIGSPPDDEIPDLPMSRIRFKKWSHAEANAILTELAQRV